MNSAPELQAGGALFLSLSLFLKGGGCLGPGLLQEVEQRLVPNGFSSFENVCTAVHSTDRHLVSGCLHFLCFTLFYSFLSHSMNFKRFICASEGLEPKSFSKRLFPSNNRVGVGV